MKRLNDFDSAVKLRDLIERIARSVVEEMRPSERIAKVISINAEKYVADVQMVGDKGALKVRFTPGMMPRSLGTIVRVGGKPGDYFITSVLNEAAANADYEPIKTAFENGDIVVDGANKIYYVDDVLPSREDYNFSIDDTAYVINDGYKMYRWGGDVLGWVPSLIGHEAIATLDADKLAVGKVDVAKLVDPASVFSQHLTVGSRGTSILTNGSMEDPGIVDGVVRNDLFGGWKSSWALGAGLITSEATSNPISGTRSMRLTAATDDDGMRYIQDRTQPVTGGQRWIYRGTFRFSRDIDKSNIADGSVVSLVAMTSNGLQNPEDFPSDNVTWTTVDSREQAVAGEDMTLQGTFEVPPGHILMIPGFYVEDALTGGGFWVDCDEFYVYPAVTQVAVVGPGQAITASINESGDMVGRDLDLTGDFRTSAERIVLGDGTLADDLYNLPRGVLAYGSRAPNVRSIGPDSEYGVMEMEFTTPEDGADRFYVFNWLFNVDPYTARGASSAMEFYLRSAYETGSRPAAPSIALSPVLLSGRMGLSTEVTQSPLYRSPIKLLSGTTYRFLLTLRGRFDMDYMDALGNTSAWLEDMGPMPANSGVKNTGGGTLFEGGSDTGSVPPTVSTQTYREVFDATWSRTFSGDRKMIDAGTDATQGYFSGTNGNQRAFIGFNDSAIRNFIGSGSIEKIELYLYFSHWYFNSGGTAVIGRHGKSGATNDYSQYNNVNFDVVRSGNWPKPGGRWVDVTSIFKNGWKDQTVKGYTLGPGPTTSKVYYGTAHGAAQNNHPKVRFTVVK